MFFCGCTSQNVVGRVTTFDNMPEIQPYQFEPVYNHGETNESERSDEDRPPKNGRLLNVDVSRCSCGKCAAKDSKREFFCCAETATVSEFVLNSGSNCITELEEFKTVCLGPLVLKFVKTVMSETGSHPGGAPSELGAPPGCELFLIVLLSE